MDGSGGLSADAPPPDEAYLYRGIFENAVWGLFLTTLDGRYLRVNPALARIYGYESPAALVEALTDIGRQLYVDPERRDAFVRIMQVEGAISGFESEVRRRDGEIIWIAESCRSVRDADGRLLWYEGTVEEITRRKRVETELRIAKEQAETASRATASFLAHMSHELRTPLNAVLGFAQLIRDASLGPLSRNYADCAAHIFDGGSNLLRIVNDVLDLVDLDAGRLQLSEDAVPLGRFLGLCIEAAASSDRIQILPPERPATLLIDLKRLRQAVVNLLSNAVRFSPGAAPVTLAAAFPAEGGIEISITDLGVGMSEADLETAFRPFGQVEALLSRRHEGMGLGLPIARAMIERHGGRLDLASMPGQGTIATIGLPPGRLLS